jgi:hypothetical protein
MESKNLIHSKMNKTNIHLLNINRNYPDFTQNQHRINHATKIKDESSHLPYSKSYHAPKLSHFFHSSTPKLSLDSSFILGDYCCSNKHSSQLDKFKHHFSKCYNKPPFDSPSNSRSFCSSCCSFEDDSNNRMGFHKQSYLLNQYDHKNHLSNLTRAAVNYGNDLSSSSSSLPYIDVNKLTASSSSSLSSSDSLPINKYINIRNLSKSILLDLLAQHDKQEQLENLYREQQQNNYNYLMSKNYKFNNDINNDDSIANNSKQVIEFSSTPKPVINHTTMILEGKF